MKAAVMRAQNAPLSLEEVRIDDPGPGEVLVSETVRDLVSGSGIAFEDRGEHELKGVGERRIYAVSAV